MTVLERSPHHTYLVKMKVSKFKSYSDDQLAQIIWDFNIEIDCVTPADVIMVLGSHDLRVAHRGIELFQQNLANYILFSGGFGRLTDQLWTKPEAQMFAEEARKLGIPEERILIEDESTNTGENIVFSWKILQKMQINPSVLLIVHKPYMIRRAWATAKKHLPEISISTTAPQISYLNYPNKNITKIDVINIMVGDLQRLQIYPARGYQVPVSIPPEVWTVYEELVRRGYTQQLIDN